MSERINLSDELFAAAARVRERHWNHLVGLGVAGPALAKLGNGQVSFGVVDAMPEASGLYQPGEGVPHICQPVISDGTLVDLVVWRPKEPDNWWLRLGYGWALNGDDLEAIFRWGGPPPHLHSTPLDWLRDGGSGSVVLDWQAPEVRALRMHEKISCDPALSTLLRDTLAASVRLPTISFAKDA